MACLSHGAVHARCVDALAVLRKETHGRGTFYAPLCRRRAGEFLLRDIDVLQGGLRWAGGHEREEQWLAVSTLPGCSNASHAQCNAAHLVANLW